MNALPITYMAREQIDLVKWDRCIQHAFNKIPYAFSYFLDNMSPGWDALIAGDYQVVMPLTWRKKWGIKYLYQPPFIQQLGIFAESEVSEIEMNSFITESKNHFQFAEIFLNFQNHLYGALHRHNFVLPLEAGYEQLKTSYKTDLLKNLRLASREQLTYGNGELEIALKLYEKEYADRVPHVKSRDYQAFRLVCISAAANNKLVLRNALDTVGAILSSALLIRDAGRLILLQSYTSATGRISHANHFLLDQVIKEFSGQSLLLDFEGSDVAGIAHFYKNFGAFNQPYFFFRYNNLPWWLKLIKP